MSLVFQEEDESDSCSTSFEKKFIIRPLFSQQNKYMNFSPARLRHKESNGNMKWLIRRPVPLIYAVYACLILFAIVISIETVWLFSCSCHKKLQKQLIAKKFFTNVDEVTENVILKDVADEGTMNVRMFRFTDSALTFKNGFPPGKPTHDLNGYRLNLTAGGLSVMDKYCKQKKVCKANLNLMELDAHIFHVLLSTRFLIRLGNVSLKRHLVRVLFLIKVIGGMFIRSVFLFFPRDTPKCP